MSVPNWKPTIGRPTNAARSARWPLHAAQPSSTPKRYTPTSAAAATERKPSAASCRAAAGRRRRTTTASVERARAWREDVRRGGRARARSGGGGGLSHLKRAMPFERRGVVAGSIVRVVCSRVASAAWGDEGWADRMASRQGVFSRDERRRCRWLAVVVNRPRDSRRRATPHLRVTLEREVGGKEVADRVPEVADGDGRVEPLEERHEGGAVWHKRR